MKKIKGRHYCHQQVRINNCWYPIWPALCACNNNVLLCVTSIYSLGHICSEFSEVFAANFRQIIISSILFFTKGEVLCELPELHSLQLIPGVGIDGAIYPAGCFLGSCKDAEITLSVKTRVNGQWRRQKRIQYVPTLSPFYLNDLVSADDWDKELDLDVREEGKGDIEHKWRILSKFIIRRFWRRKTVTQTVLLREWWLFWRKSLNF